LKDATRQIWKAWIPAIIWLCIITFESTDYLSSDHTSRILYPVLHYLLGLDLVRFEVWHHYIRKTGHFVGYFTLSCLLFRAWKASLPVAAAKRWVMRWANVSFLMTVLVASLDEWHQTFIPSRTGTVRDAILDSAAALTAQIVTFLLLRGTRPQASKRSSSVVP
jgi:VanZ family protein